MRIRPLDSSRRRDVRAFVRLPFALYRHCPQWVPPLVSDVRAGLDPRKHPFYQHSQAAFFLAESDGQTVGRIGVLDNRRYNDYHGTRAAFFHWFDCVDDQAVARALFERACDWARGRGLEVMLGPKGLLRSDGMGILVEGFQHRPAMGIPYNHPYYARLVEGAGFEKEIDYLSGLLHGDYRLPQRFFDIAERVKERRGFAIKSFKNKREMRAWGYRIKDVNNAAFPEVWGFYPMGDDDIERSIQQLSFIADPRLIKLVLKGDDVIGFLLVYPDLSDGLQRAKGRLWPFGWWHILRERKRTRWLNINGLGLLPEYQGLGANAVLYTEMQKSVVARGADYADVAQVAETNLKSMGEMQAIGVEWYKRHRIYRRELSATTAFGIR
ncbi:MAG: hypothetical protein JXA74_05100 [Anaerolineae bacterium]|nr:hypothetical protein [Anaerolineae bacterium]